MIVSITINHVEPEQQVSLRARASILHRSRPVRCRCGWTVRGSPNYKLSFVEVDFDLQRGRESGGGGCGRCIPQPSLGSKDAAGAGRERGRRGWEQGRSRAGGAGSRAGAGREQGGGYEGDISTPAVPYDCRQVPLPCSTAACTVGGHITLHMHAHNFQTL